MFLNSLKSLASAAGRRRLRQLRAQAVPPNPWTWNRARLLFLSGVFALPALTSCDRVKNALHPSGPDLRWQSDSTLLASDPGVVFRLVHDNDNNTLIFPIGTIGGSGARELKLSRRGWSAFDLKYLHSAAQVVVTRNGRATSDMLRHRGFWEPQALDTMLVRACRPGVPIPFALAEVRGNKAFIATNAPPVPLKYSAQISEGELRSALSAIPLLIAPTVGISPTQLARYERRVSQVVSAAGPHPTLVVSYDDPIAAPDSLLPMTERPRQFIVVLDKGVYGYKPSWTYKTLGNMRDVAPLRFLDALDVNGDGLVELFFGLRDAPNAINTRILRFETDAWRDMLEFWPRTPCAY